MKYNCVICHNEFEMGENGIFMDGDLPGCDVCAGVERDAEGYSWEPGETEHTYCDLDGNNPHVVTREEAFRETK